MKELEFLKNTKGGPFDHLTELLRINTIKIGIILCILLIIIYIIFGGGGWFYQIKKLLKKIIEIIKIILDKL